MSDNPFAPPGAAVEDVGEAELVYAGFWIRVLAALIDSVLILAVTAPLLIALYGWAYYDDSQRSGIVAGPADVLVSYVLPAIATVVFWLTKQATPGKMLLSMRIVDAKTGKPPTPGQALGRYAGYYVSLLGLGLGILWVAIDSRKQGWHDKLAGTVVVRHKRSGARPVKFDGA